MNYEVILPLEAQADLRKLPRSEAKRIAAKLKTFLSTDPWPHGKNPKRLRGAEKSYRLRMGNYRALYKIKNNKVVVFAIGDRKNIYH